MTSRALTRKSLSVLASVLVLAVPCAPAFSQTALDDDELSEVRGGFLAANGMMFDFGATMRTFIDGQMALETTLTLSDTGRTINQTSGDIPNALPLDSQAIPGLDLSTIQGNGGIVAGVGGGTAFVQNASDNQIRNMIVNTADGRDIRLDTVITVVMPNLPQLQQAMQLDQLRTSLEQAIGTSLRAALTH